jgi:hypothetical protein
MISSLMVGKCCKEWNERWGSSATFSRRPADAFFGIDLVGVPADRARGEILDIIRKGRKVLLQLESIAFIDLCSIQADEFQSLLIDYSCY